MCTYITIDCPRLVSVLCHVLLELWRFLSEEIVGHSPLGAVSNCESFSADQIEKPPVEKPPLPLIAIGGFQYWSRQFIKYYIILRVTLETQNKQPYYPNILVHFSQPNIQSFSIMSPWEAPLVREDKVRLEVEEERVGGHRAAWQQSKVNIILYTDKVGPRQGTSTLSLRSGCPLWPTLKLRIRQTVVCITVGFLVLLLVSKVWLSFHVWRSRRFN